MKPFESPHLPRLIKMILMGFSGKGKSTAIVPLAIPNLIPDFPGYRLRILDFDGKFLEVAEQNLAARLDRTRANRLRLTPITKEQYDTAANNIDIEVIREKTKMTKNGLDLIGSPQGWEKMEKILTSWRKDDTPEIITVIDSWTHMRTPIIAWCMNLQGKRLYNFGIRAVGHDARSDYMCPQAMLKGMMTDLTALKSNVIVTSHQSPVDMKIKVGRDEKGNMIEEVAHSEMAMSNVGSAGRIELPSEFNHLLVVAADSEGNRKISTQIEDGVTTKTPFFAFADKSYTLNDGLARYFMLGRK